MHIAINPTYSTNATIKSHPLFVVVARFYRRLPDEEERTCNALPRDSLFAGDGFGSYLPRRARGATGSLFEYFGGDLVGSHDANYG